MVTDRLWVQPGILWNPWGFRLGTPFTDNQSRLLSVYYLPFTVHRRVER